MGVDAAPPLQHGQARALLKALVDSLRLHVIGALHNGERCVCEITEELNLAHQSFCSISR